ncbi:MAG TPA: MFS transporter [Actinocrinis sp.]|uniref:MFS transporter n=1 Tax=Actinocrinis sp. TaxID=1920516 RepID=UPI002DDCCBDA|nr:MFS transporter [Actinocrinis sp.]HEV2345266.1 MFS transporter [Actinocrinis sp.]
MTDQPTTATLASADTAADALANSAADGEQPWPGPADGSARRPGPQAPSDTGPQAPSDTGPQAPSDTGPRARFDRALGRLLPPSGPLRPLAGSVFVATAGGGLLMGSSTLYLTRIVGMSVDLVGLGLTVGGALGLAAGPLVGHLADRRGPREVHIATMVAGAVATGGYALVRSFAVLVLVALLTTAIGAAASASRAPLIRALTGNGSTSFLSYQRAVSNVGIMLGILVATIGIQLDTAAAYLAMISIGAATLLVAGALLLRLPHVEPLVAERSASSRRAALADRPYLAATLVNGAMSVHLAIPTFALPLWIVNHTSAPRVAVTGFMIVNGLLVVGLQVRASRGVVDPRSAGVRMRWAGLAIFAGSALIGVMPGRSWWAALLVLLAATVVYTFGEIWQAAASFELAFGLAQPHMQGQYAGIFGLGAGAANTVAPAILAPLCLDRGMPGWLALGVLFAIFGALTPAVVRWAENNRVAFTVQAGV